MPVLPHGALAHLPPATVAAIFGIAAGLAVFGALALLHAPAVGLAERTLVRTSRLRRARLGGRSAADPVLSAEERAGIAGVNLLPWRLGCALAACWAAYTLVGPTPHVAVGLAGVALPSLWRRRRLAAAQEHLEPQVAAFLREIDVFLRTPTTPARALQAVADLGGQGILMRRLRLHVETKLDGGVLEVLQALHADIGAPELRYLALQIGLSQREALLRPDFLRTVMDDIDRRTRARAEAGIKSAHTALIGPMVLVVALPLMMIPVLPYAARAAEVLGG